jgi:hypothetical protein
MLAVVTFGIASFHVAETGKAKVSGARRFRCEMTAFVVPSGARGCVRPVVREGIGLFGKWEFVLGEVQGRWLAGAIVAVRR